MTMDLTVDHYDTWDDLLVYMDGSAAVIGEMMLPILEPTGPAALRPARDLGNAFQLTNFLRDVAEDLDRGRVYLPQEDLERFGADPRRRQVDDAWRALMRFEIDRCRDAVRSADRGIAMLPPGVGALRAARPVHLYREILDRIEAADYDVFASGRGCRPRRKLAVRRSRSHCVVRLSWLTVVLAVAGLVSGTGPDVVECPRCGPRPGAVRTVRSSS